MTLEIIHGPYTGAMSFFNPVDKNIDIRIIYSCPH
jgi:hypothetical protein